MYGWVATLSIKQTIEKDEKKTILSFPDWHAHNIGV